LREPSKKSSAGAPHFGVDLELGCKGNGFNNLLISFLSYPLKDNITRCLGGCTECGGVLQEFEVMSRLNACLSKACKLVRSIPLAQMKVLGFGHLELGAKASQKICKQSTTNKGLLCLQQSEKGVMNEVPIHQLPALRAR
jgi:hypothetical protein